MAKRNPPSQADDTMTSSAPSEARASRSRTRGTRTAAEPRSGADVPDITDTQAARPSPVDTTAPEDTIAADPDATRLEPREDEEPRDAPTQEEIRARAYHLYLERGGTDGMHEDDWYRAEQELRHNRKR
jgi:DUF2934 family protein